MFRIIIFQSLTLFTCLLLSCKKYISSDEFKLDTKPDKTDSKSNNKHYSEQEVQEFFAQENLTMKDIISRFGAPNTKNKRKERIEFNYIFDNFYKPRPFGGELCAIKVRFDNDGNFLFYSSTY